MEGPGGLRYDGSSRVEPQIFEKIAILRRHVQGGFQFDEDCFTNELVYVKVPQSHMTTVANAAAVSPEVAQLREVIEKQPACLVRVSLDGTLLAVNEAALSIFGAENLGQVLEQSLPGRFLPDQQKLWDDFCSRVWTSGAGSVECELADLAGEKRPALLKGVARRDHHDGIDSLFITIRDTSSRVRLEQAVVSAAQLRSPESQQLVEDARQEQRRLEAALE
jgi:PAS domain S-box-containing protein